MIPTRLAAVIALVALADIVLATDDGSIGREIVDITSGSFVPDEVRVAELSPETGREGG